jgi:signal transduction histidine kinase
LSGIAVETGRPVVVDDYASHPAAIQPERPLRGVIAVPVGGDAGVRAVVLGARRDAAISAFQREAVLLLAEQAGRALDRAGAFEADRRTVEQLRILDIRTQDFISTVSHELRTPLTVIHGLGQTLARRWDELAADRRTDLLVRIDANAERLAVMVRSLLDTSALEEGRLDLQPVPTPLRETVARLLHRLATVTAAHPVELDIPEGLEIVADPGLFEHIIENLLTNVAKHTPQGTRVHITAAPSDPASASRSETMGRASRRRTCHTCSTASSEAVPRPVVRAAAWGSGSRWHARSWRPTGPTSTWPRRPGAAPSFRFEMPASARGVGRP